MRAIKKQPTGFTQVTNIVLNDEKLSWKAKGLYSYIYSKPDGWDFSGRRMCKQAADGRDGTLSGIKELEEAGYIFREKHKTGRITYHILVDPNTEKPDKAIAKPKPEKVYDGGAVLRKSRPISNKEVKVIKSINNKKNTPALKTLNGTLLVNEKRNYGELENVVLTDEQYAKLTERLGAQLRDELIEELSLYIPNKPGKKYTDHYAVILVWSKSKKNEAKGRTKSFSVING